MAMKGVHQKGRRAGVPVTDVPAGSGKASVPCPPDAGHHLEHSVMLRRQSRRSKEEHGDILYRKETGGCPSRLPIILHPP